MLAAAVSAQDKPQLPDAPGKAAVVKLCSNCHGAQIVLGKPHSEDGWTAIVADMAQRGMEGTEDEMYDVIQYLTRNIKALPAVKVNVNKASAKELETGLEISAKDAEALVAARAKAAFQSIDDVKKVAGIDAARIEAKKSRLIF